MQTNDEAVLNIRKHNMSWIVNWNQTCGKKTWLKIRLNITIGRMSVILAVFIHLLLVLLAKTKILNKWKIFVSGGENSNRDDDIGRRKRAS